MLKFFRQIRKKLLTENRFSQYLVYAIGEIFLVVIGILIALQVNNWNENLKTKAEEKKILLELKEGFTSDLEDLSFNAMIMNAATKSCATLIDHIDETLPFHDSLKIHFAGSIFRTRFISNSGPYEALKSKGLELISNDTLRNKIVKMHDFYFETIKTFENGETLSDNYLIDFCTKHFDVVQMVTVNKTDEIVGGKMTPLDYEALKQNAEYKTLLKTAKTQNELLVYRLNDICKKLEILIDTIDKNV